MDSGESIIETGVDRLVDLIKEKIKISIQEAAKSLGVSPTVVEEWADFLEEEGVVAVEYKLTTPYLSMKELTKKEHEEKVKEFHDKKDILIRKAEVMVGTLDKQAIEFQKLKEEFDKLKDELGNKIHPVKSELKALEDYQAIKQKLDSELLLQKKETFTRFQQMQKEIMKEQRRYEQLIEKVVEEEEKIKQEKVEALTLKNMESILEKRLNDLKVTTNKIGKKLNRGNIGLNHSVDHAERLKKIVKSIKEKAIKEKKELDSIVRKGKWHEKKIMGLQGRLLKKFGKKTKEKGDVGKVAKKFKAFFEKRAKIDALISKVNHDRVELEHDLIKLIRAAKSFEWSSKSASMGRHTVELVKRFEEIDKRKMEFEKEIMQLRKTIAA